jgi:hypothetical protein
MLPVMRDDFLLNKISCNKQDSFINIFSLPFITTGLTLTVTKNVSFNKDKQEMGEA